MGSRLATILILCLASFVLCPSPIRAAAAPTRTDEKGGSFITLFDGNDLAGWHGQETADPRKFTALSGDEKAKQLARNAKDLKEHWRVENNEIVNDGQGVYLTTDKDYGDIELCVDFKIGPKGDSGVYLRGTPQVQIWDFSEPSYANLGADKGSGGLWNNSPGNPGKVPLTLADNPIGQWNTFRIIQTGARTTVYLNGKLVVDHAILTLPTKVPSGSLGRIGSLKGTSDKSLFPMALGSYGHRITHQLRPINMNGRSILSETSILENYWDRANPIPARGPIQLQTHGSEIRWRNIKVREIPAEEANAILAKHGAEGFSTIFSGQDLTGWAGPIDQYQVKDGVLMCKPEEGGTIYYNKEVTDFAARLEFRLPPGGNNGLAIRYPGEGDTAYVGMCELQILDDSTTKYGKLDPRQYHGSAYGMVPAKVGYQRPVGLWNFQEVTVKGFEGQGRAQRYRDSRHRPEHRQEFHGQLRPPRQGPGLRLLWSRRPQRPGRVPQHRN